MIFEGGYSARGGDGEMMSRVKDILSSMAELGAIEALLIAGATILPWVFLCMEL